MSSNSPSRDAYQSPHGIEQSRRDFMRDHPDLYRYIGLVESRKALGSAADSLSDHASQSRVWAAESRAEMERMAMVEASARGDSR